MPDKLAPYQDVRALVGDVPRLVLLDGLQTPSGGPVIAVATGPARRPVLTALVSFATLAAPRVEGGAV